MNKRKIDINSLRIASPCQMSWDAMTGDERSRFCTLCDLNVYNVAGMTVDEVGRLVADREGRICMRLYRRADGTVVTKDCPVGVRSTRKRMTALAGAAFATILGFFSVSYAQKNATKIDGSKVKIVRSVDPIGKSSLVGSIVDPNGALVPNVEIRLYQGQIKQVATVRSDADGQFDFASVPAGVYELRISAAVGFLKLIVKDLEIRPGEKHEITLMLQLDPGVEVLVGVVASEPLIDLTSNERKTVITRDMLDRLPGGRP